jgi:CRP-like cAMP-binding protein
MTPVAHRAPPLNVIPFLKVDADAPSVLLTPRQREELARIGTRLRLPARTLIYREESAAQWVFAIAEGVVKSYRELPSGRRTIAAFLFSRDLFGLAENGRYVNSAQAITRVVVYRLPVTELTVLLKHDSDLQFKFLMKVTQALREAQRRTILVSRRDAAGRFAMFIALMSEHQDRATPGGRTVSLPMTRSDIGAFLGLSLESVSRAAAELERQGLVEFEGRHGVRIVDQDRLARLVAAV